MKINATILAAALGLASATLASAQQEIYLTGSTAARGAVYNALAAGVGLDAAPSVILSYGSSTAANGTYMEFVGAISGTSTIIKCHWSGSEAGVVDVSSTTQTESFLADAGTSGVPATTTTSSASPTSGQLITHTVDAAMADNALLYSKNPTSSAHQTGPVVIVPFVFVKNNCASLPGVSDYSSFTGLTADQFKILASGGDFLALFTGNPADQNTFVYLAGRDDNSGTRVNTLAETGYGIKTAVQQVILSGGVLTPAAYTDEGQSSGGTLAGSLVDTSASTDSIQGTAGFSVVAYLGLADDATAEGSPNNAIRLTYNGVAYSTAAVENGQYTIWGNEYVLYKNGSLSYITGLTSALGNTTTGISAHTDGFEIPIASMNVTRLPSNGPTQSPLY